MPKISSKNQVTLPVDVLESVGLKAGDQVCIEAEEPDRIVVTRANPDPRSAIGSLDGMYPPGYLEELRKDWD